MTWLQNSFTNAAHSTSWKKNIAPLSQQLKNYACNRWLNFWSAKAIEQIFAAHPRVKPNSNVFHKSIDFYIDGIAFDHKTTIFPHHVPHPIGYYWYHRAELIKWLYTHQSQQGRKHHQNKLFMVLYNKANLQHWQLKAHIGLLQEKIIAYLEGFEQEQLTRITLGEKEIFSDIIWIIKQ